MDKYYIDFETRSEYDLEQVGTMKYLSGAFADILFMSWNKNQTSTKLWLPGAPPPFTIQPNDKVYAFNLGGFDLRVWNMLGSHYNFEPLQLKNCVDVMALCGRFNLPQQLDRVAKILKVPWQKDSQGKALIKIFCSPPFAGTREQQIAFYKYGLIDTNTMIAVLNALPADELEPREQRIWEDTVRMNHRGLPVDEAAIKRIFAVTTWYKTKEAKRLPIITNERVKTVGQRDAILNWCEEKGVQLDNLQAATVEDALDNMPLPSDVRLVLELRQDLSKTSVSKFNSLFNQMWLQRIYDNLRYYRASTGRYGGQAFQIHNLPRAKTDDVEGTIEKFFDGTVLNLDVLYLAKALIRAMVTAEPEHILVVNDFSSIEYIILMWVAGQWDAVENFRNGRDPYKDMAALLFKCLYEEVTDEQRNLAKPVVLGAGYNLGPGGYIHYAKQYGIDINIQEATYSINTYRQSKPKVVDLWYALRNASIKAIEQVGTTFSAGRGNFKVIFDRNGTKWLRYILPSGRPLFYNDPKVIDGKYGRIASHMGVHPKTHQWVRLELSPARLTENEIQALARDVLCYTQTTLLDSKIDLLASVHDETVCQIPLDQIGIADKLIHKRHEIPPAWCHDLPLQAKMFTAKRYKKG